MRTSYQFTCRKCDTLATVLLDHDTPDKLSAVGPCNTCGSPDLKRVWNANFHLPYGDTDFASVAGSKWKRPLSYEDAFGVEGDRGGVAWDPDSYTDPEVEVHKAFGDAA